MIDLKELILSKDNLIPLLRKLGKESRLIAPVKNEYGDTLFSVINDIDETEIDNPSHALPEESFHCVWQQR